MLTAAAEQKRGSSGVHPQSNCRKLSSSSSFRPGEIPKFWDVFVNYRYVMLHEDKNIAAWKPLCDMMCCFNASLMLRSARKTRSSHLYSII